MAVDVSFCDIISKPVDDTYELVQTLGIYCWQYEKTQQNALFFLPRFSFNENKDYLKQVYPDIENDVDELSGKGIYTSIWQIARVYNKVSINEPEKILGNDFHTLSAFQAWCSAQNLYERELNEQQIYVLREERRFAKYKYTNIQNSPATIYYYWNEILNKQIIKGKKQN